MNRISALLWGVVERESPDSVNGKIAHALINHLEDLHTTSCKQLADLCGVSKPTMSRFAHDLGFTDFYEFRLALEQFSPYRRARWNAGADEEDNPLDAFSESLRKNSSFLRDKDVQRGINELASDLHTFRASYLVGHMQSGNAASSLRYHLYRDTGRVHFPKGNKERSRIINPLKSGTMLVVFSVSGTYLSTHHDESKFIKEPGSKVWLLTCDPYVSTPSKVDAVINTCTGDICTGGNLALETLATAIAFSYFDQERNKRPDDRQRF